MATRIDVDINALEKKDVQKEIIDNAIEEISSQWISLYNNIASDEDIRKLHPKKIQAINLYLSGLYTFDQIGKMVNAAPLTIMTWFKDPKIQTVIQAMQEREYKFMESYLQNLRTRAINSLSDLMDSENENVKLNASKEVLKATGMSNPVQKIQIEKKIDNIELGMKNVINANYDIDISDVVEEFKK